MTDIPPPLPHLSGSPPTPRFVKRAYTALVLSVAAWAVFIFSFYLFATVKQASIILPLFGWRMERETVAGISLFAGGLFGFIGTLLGVSSRKARAGMIAIVVGGLQFALWLLLIVAALIAVARE